MEADKINADELVCSIESKVYIKQCYPFWKN